MFATHLSVALAVLSAGIRKRLPYNFKLKTAREREPRFAKQVRQNVFIFRRSGSKASKAKAKNFPSNLQLWF